jgi:ketosteroid isomerase-like protein
MAQRLDFNSLRQAVEGRDVERMLDLFADDAELELVNRNNPPRSPRRFEGKDQIRRYYQDIFSRDMTHRVQEEVVGDDRASYLDNCRYPDGTHVLSACTLDLRDGKIQRQVGIEVWDE